MQAGRPSQTKALARLDDRYARGPLALLRDVPQLAFLLIAAVFAGGAATVLSQSDPAPAEAPPTFSADPAPSADAGATTIGPRVGEQVDAYVARTRARTLDLGATQPQQELTALISLTARLTPEQVVDLVGEARPVRVVLRAPLPAGQTPETVLLPVTNLVDDVSTASQTIASRKAAAVPDLRAFSLTIDAGAQPGARAAADADVAGVQAEADSFAAGCGCVIAVVVTAPAQLLSALSRSPAVRAVDPAAPGADVEKLQVMPLLIDAAGAVDMIPRPPA